MKKLCSLFFLLILGACGSMGGDTYTRCAYVPAGLVADDVGDTVITVKGYDEDILLWTVSTTLTRDEFDEAFSQGVYLSDDEIHELFEYYAQREMEGITFHVDELTNEHIPITKIYDYEVIDDDELNRIWGVDNFENTVTLSSAIASLEDQEAECVLIELEEEEYDEEAED